MPNLSLTPTQCYAAMQAHDNRFDGRFFVGVSSTRVYCRPICRVRMPKLHNCIFYSHAATAEQAGYRPCLKCRPELAPGNGLMDKVKRTAHLIAEAIQQGALNDASVESLAADFNLGSRQLRRVVESEYGVSPLALAQSYRLLMAKQLLTDTGLKIIDVAFASGFSSLRRFNQAFQTHYRLSPTELRKHKTANRTQDIVVRLGYRPPLAWQALINFLGSRSSSQVERVVGNEYQRIVKIDSAIGWISAKPDPASNSIFVTVAPSLLGHLPRLQHRLRHLFDLDADPFAIESELRRDTLLKQCIKHTPGLRIPGAWSGFEIALRAILGQQVSVKAATTLFGRFVTAFGWAIDEPFAELTHAAPDPARIAETPLHDIIALGLTQRRAETVKLLATQVAQQKIDLDNHQDHSVLENLLALPGIGPWTVQYIAMRTARDPNAIPQSDLGLMKVLGVTKPQQVIERAEKWQPWRAYGAMHLWNSLDAGG